MGFKNPSDGESIADINVTPLVDVMLVLLVIFMITAPLMLNGINLELPKTAEVNPMNLSTQQVILSLTKSEDLFIGDTKLEKDEVIRNVKSKFLETKTNILYLRADYAISYGKVAKLMSHLKSEGISQIALVTETE